MSLKSIWRSYRGGGRTDSRVQDRNTEGQTVLHAANTEKEMKTYLVLRVLQNHWTH